MKANNLTISIPTPKCKKSCPFCVSKMTFGVDDNLELFQKNLIKVRKFADIAQVSSVLVTGKGEPMDNLHDLLDVCEVFKDFPLEIQTNGTLLTEDNINYIKKFGINVVAISIWNPKELYSFSEIAKELNKFAIVRITIILNNAWKGTSFREVLNFCKTHKISQLTFRIPTVPKTIKDNAESIKTKNWIVKNSNDYDHILKDLKSYLNGDNFVRKLPFDSTSIYDIEGISVATFDYCIQENSNSDDIRSLIYQSDGHLYTTWDKSGSILF